jgi:dTDP-4-amino-4,6-dideoxygalactose transaminase
MKKKIKLFDPHIGKNEEKQIISVLKSGFWASGAGNGKVKQFETNFNKYIGADFCVSVNSGTSALHHALSLFDIKNKEVILPSLSFVSTAHSVLYNGGKPIFVDVDPNTLCIDPEQIRKHITKKTKVILPVHFGGLPANLKEIMKVCHEEGIILVEDAAHAAGAKFKDKLIGCHGSAVCFSFHPVKNLAMPNGGAITLNGKNSKNYKKTLQIKRWCGITNRKSHNYDISDLGYNSYLNEFSAAIGLEQLKKLDFLNSKREKIARQYRKKINLENKMPLEKGCSYHIYWIRVKKRNDFMHKMLNYGIETGIHYNPIHKMSFYKNNYKLPLTESISKEIVSIPIHPNITNEQVSYIIEHINQLI